MVDMVVAVDMVARVGDPFAPLVSLPVSGVVIMAAAVVVVVVAVVGAVQADSTWRSSGSPTHWVKGSRNPSKTQLCKGFKLA